MSISAEPPSVYSYSMDEWLAHWRDALLWDPLATFTVALVLATFALWLATRRLWLDGESQTRVANRAYVGTERMTVRRLPRHKTLPVETYRFEFKWENAGSTPARNVSINSGYVAWDQPPPPDFQYNRDAPIGYLTVIPPLQLRKGYIDVPSNMLTPFEEHLEFYVYSAIEYDDVFAGSPRHRTEICFKVVFLGAIGHRDTRVDTQIFGEFNGSDDECLFPPSSIERRG